MSLGFEVLLGTHVFFARRYTVFEKISGLTTNEHELGGISDRIEIIATMAMESSE